MRTLSCISVVVVFASCAGQKSTVSAEEAFGASRAAPTQPAQTAQSGTAATAPAADLAPASREPMAPEKWARTFRRPVECEAAARSMAQQSGRAAAWPYLKACAARPDFGLLTGLVDNWLPELKAKPEAAGVLAQVIANRGGRITSDLQLLQQRRLPLFELTAALSQPEAFKGRYLVFVGRIEKLKSSKGRQELVLVERARSDEESRVMGANSYGSVSSSRGSGSAQGSYRTDRYGSGSAQVSGEYSRSGSYMSGQLETRSTVSFDDTNQQILARLAGPDPFLSIDRSFVFLVRFDGARKVDADEADDEEPRLMALVSLVSYHDLNAGGTVAE